MVKLVARILLYMLAPLAGVIAGTLGGIDFNPNSNILSIDVREVSYALSLAITSLIGGGTFWVSRLVKRNGGQT